MYKPNLTQTKWFWLVWVSVLVKPSNTTGGHFCKVKILNQYHLLSKIIIGKFTVLIFVTQYPNLRLKLLHHDTSSSSVQLMSTMWICRTRYLNFFKLLQKLFIYNDYQRDSIPIKLRVRNNHTNGDKLKVQSSCCLRLFSTFPNYYINPQLTTITSFSISTL